MAVKLRLKSMGAKPAPVVEAKEVTSPILRV